MRRSICLAVVCLFAASAYGQDASQIAAFQEGRFLDAAAPETRTAVNGADEAAFAARALLAACMTGARQPPAERIEQAEHLARIAIEADPSHVEGRLQLAIAMSLKLRPMSRRDAFRSGLGDEVRRLAQGVLRDDPGNAYAHGLLSVWHVEVVRRGGGLGARLMGASLKAARRHYEAAAARGDDPSVHWQYARALTALDAERWREEIEAALSAARGAEPADALQRVMAARADTLQRFLDTQPADAVEAYAEATL